MGWIYFDSLLRYAGGGSAGVEVTTKMLRFRWHFKCIFLTENLCILILILLKFVPTGPIDNELALTQVMAWCWTVTKPLPEPMLTKLYDTQRSLRTSRSTENWAVKRLIAEEILMKNCFFYLINYTRKCNMIFQPLKKVARALANH